MTIARPVLPHPVSHDLAPDHPPAPTVLVVDDEDCVRHVASLMLRASGFATVEAPDGPSAVDCLRQPGRQIDAVVMDMFMPGMTGEEALQQMRRARPSVPVVLMSGLEAVAAAAQRSWGTGTTVLPKPFNRAGLIEALRLVLAM
jgi:CheY-like chemotaxis protein